LIVLVVAATAVIGGCDDEEPIRRYDVPKPGVVDPHGDVPQRDPLGASQPPKRTRPGLTYDLPDGWRQKPLGPMQIAAFDVGDPNDPQAQVTVTYFQMQLDIPSNINRWLGQIGRAPIEPAQAQQLVTPGPLDPPATSMKTVLKGEQLAMSVAMVEQGDGWWFIKLMGAAETVDAVQRAGRR